MPPGFYAATRRGMSLDPFKFRFHIKRVPSMGRCVCESREDATQAYSYGAVRVFDSAMRRV
jgi:hypothetical protein